MEIAGLTIRVDVDLTKLRAQLGTIQAALDPLNKTMGEFAQTTAGVQKAANTTASSIQNLSNKNKEASSTTANLGRFMRENITALLGNNVAAIALGTALGNVLTQAVSRVVLAFAESILQVQRLQNEFALIEGMTLDTSVVFNALADASLKSASTLEELSSRFTQLAASVRGTRVTVREALDVFLEQEQALQRIQRQTIGGAFSNTLTQFGRLVTTADNAVGTSNLLISALNAIGQGFNFLASALHRGTGQGGVISGLDSMNATLDGIITRLEVVRRQLREAGGAPPTAVPRDAPASVLQNLERRRQLQAEILELERNELMVQGQIDDAMLGPAAGAARLRRLAIHRDIVATLGQEIAIGGLLRQEQEVRNRLFQIELQLIQAGMSANRARLEAAQHEAQIRQAIAATAFQGLRQELGDPLTLEREQHQQRLQNLQTFVDSQQAIIDGQLQREAISAEAHGERMLELQRQQNALVLAERARNAFAEFQIQNQAYNMLLSNLAVTSQHAVELLQILGQKSKAFAVAAVVISKGMAIAQTIQQGITASMAALAPPPIGLGPVAGQPLSAAIRALTAVNVGLIAATGIAQIASTLSGGGGAGSGGLGSASTPAEIEGSAPMRIVIEPVDPAAIFTGEQLNNLIGKINSEAENGRVVIASKLIS